MTCPESLPLPDNLRDILDQNIHYSPDALPNALRSGPHPSAKLLIVNCSTPMTPTHVNKAIEINYGLERFKGIIDIQHVTASYQEPLPMEVNKNTIILTTGSAVDLGKNPELPWTYTFRELFLRRAVAAESAILAPCFGFAQLARLHTNSMESAFPKGVRVLGRIPIDIRSSHPLFYGFKQLSGYCHHNGSVPLELIYNNSGSMQVHALSYDKSRPVPAMVTFNQAGTIIGTEFHRELLEEQLIVLYTRKVEQILDTLLNRAISSEAVYDPGIIAQAFRLLEKDGIIDSVKQFIEKNGERDCLKQGNIIEWLRSLVINYRVDVIQALEDKFSYLGLEGFQNIGFSKGYIANTGISGNEPYSKQASLLFFDNFLRMSLMAMNGSKPDMAFGSVAHIETEDSSLYTPIVTAYNQMEGKSMLYFPEIVGSEHQLQEIKEVLQKNKWLRQIDEHSLSKWKIYEDCDMDKPDGPPNDPSLRDFYRMEFDSLLDSAAKNMDVISIKNENGDLQALSILVSEDLRNNSLIFQITLMNPDFGIERVDIHNRLIMMAKNIAQKHNHSVIVSSVQDSDWMTAQTYMHSDFVISDHFENLTFNFFQNGQMPILHYPSKNSDKHIVPDEFYRGMQKTGGMHVWKKGDTVSPLFILVRNTDILSYLEEYPHKYQVGCAVLPIQADKQLESVDTEFFVVFGDPSRY